MSHLSGALIVLAMMVAVIEAWPWSLIPIGIAAWLCWLARRPQDGGK
jgi:hypothetical protein